MSAVSSLLSSSTVWNLSKLNSASTVSSTSGTISSSSTSATTSSDSVDISKPGELYSKLQALQKSDPAKFKEVVSDIAQKLKTASESQTGNEAKMTSDLAAKFQSVADGGDISQLKPPSPPSGQGAPNQTGISAYAQQSAMSSTDSSQSAGGTHGPSSEMKALFDSFVDEVNTALGS